MSAPILYLPARFKTGWGWLHVAAAPPHHPQALAVVVKTADRRADLWWFDPGDIPVIAAGLRCALPVLPGLPWLPLTGYGFTALPVGVQPVPPFPR